MNVEEPVGLAGIGVLFERRGSKSVATIRSIQPLSSADREGTLKQGDELIAVNGNDASGWDLAKVKRVLVGRNGSTCVLTVRQQGVHGAIDVTLMRGCLEWWELHDRVSLTEQQLSESEKSTVEFRDMWMAESKRATSENTQREEIAIELEGFRAALASTRNALRVADDELAKEYAKSSEFKTELSRVQSSLQGRLAEAADREQVLVKEQQDFLQRSKEATVACNKAEAERDEAEKEIRKLRQDIEDIKRQVSGAEEERDLSHRMYREVDFARKTAMQRLADAQASLALLTSDNEALKKDLLRMQQDADREGGRKAQTDDELQQALTSARASQKELEQLREARDGLCEEKEALCNQVVRLQAALGEKEKENKSQGDKIAQLNTRLSDTVATSVDMEGQRNQTSREVEAMRRRAESAEAAAAAAEKKAADLAQKMAGYDEVTRDKAGLQHQVVALSAKLEETQNALADSEAKLAHVTTSESAKDLRIRTTEEEMAKGANQNQSLARDHAALQMKFSELEAAHKGCQAAKDLLIDYRGTIENLQDGIKSRDAEILRCPLLAHICTHTNEEKERQKRKEK